jgi:hypothetical protein
MRNSFDWFGFLFFNSKLLVALDAALWAASVLNRSLAHAAEAGEAAIVPPVSAHHSIDSYLQQSAPRTA